MPTVTLQNWRPRGPKSWRYSWRDLAQALGLSEAAVKYRVWRTKELDPSDLSSVLALAARLQRRRMST